MKKLFPSIVTFIVIGLQSGFAQQSEFDVYYPAIEKTIEAVASEATSDYMKIPFYREALDHTYFTEREASELLSVIHDNVKISRHGNRVKLNYELPKESLKSNPPDYLIKVLEKEENKYKNNHLNKVSEYSTSKMIKGNNYRFTKTFLSNNLMISNINSRPTASFGMGVFSGFDYVELDKKDIGKAFDLNGLNFKLIDIYENKLVVEPMGSKSATDKYRPVTNLLFMSTNQEETERYINKNHYNGSTQNVRLENSNVWHLTTANSASVPIELYDYVKSEQPITKAGLKKLFDTGIFTNEKGKFYIIFELDVPAEKLFLLQPKYEHQKQISL